MDGLAEALERALSDLQPEPDVCIFTGDYRFEDWGDCQRVYPRMQKIVRSIRTKYGTYGILGNHDAAEIAFALEEFGVRMLVNEAAGIEKANGTLWLLGVDDIFDYGCDDLPAALAGVPPAGIQDSAFPFARTLQRGAGRRHSTLFDRSHARRPDSFARPWRRKAQCPLSAQSGVWAWRYRSMQGYTSAGVGCSSLPIRFHCPPELVLIELVKGCRRKRGREL